MTVSIEATFEWVGDRTLFERAAKNLRDPEELMESIGIVGMAGSKRRLIESLDPGAIHTSLLEASISVSGAGSGDGDTIFEVGRAEVAIGSRVTYAAQQNFGGTILPRAPNEALAIPLTDELKRSGLGPREIDPTGDALTFIPTRGGASGNVIGILVLDEDDFGSGSEGTALFALARSVTQQGKFFMGWDEGDVETIEQDVWPKFLAG